MELYCMYNETRNEIYGYNFIPSMFLNIENAYKKTGIVFKNNHFSVNCIETIIMQREKITYKKITKENIKNYKSDIYKIKKALNKYKEKKYYYVANDIIISYFLDNYLDFIKTMEEDVW